jgi:hypothetical protein
MKLNRFSVYLQFALIRYLETCEDSQEGGFAATGWTNQSHAVDVIHLEGDLLQRDVIAEAL